MPRRRRVGRSHPHAARSESLRRHRRRLALARWLALVLTAEGQGLGWSSPWSPCVVGSTALGRYALRRDLAGARRRSADAGRPGGTGPPRRAHHEPAVRRREGRAVRPGRRVPRRGIEPVVLQPGDDLLELAQDAIDRGRRRHRHGRRRRLAGAGGLGGDGGGRARSCASPPAPATTSPSTSASTATTSSARSTPFGDAVERRIDLAEVNGRVFVNNVSLGVYAKIVQSPDVPRRQAPDHRRACSPSSLGPGAEPFDLHFTGPDGTAPRRRPDHPGVQQPLRADVARRVRQPGPARHRRLGDRRGRDPRRRRRRRLRRRRVRRAPRPLPRLDRVERRRPSP